MAQCPYCTSTIPPTAKTCAICGRDVPSGTPSRAAAPDTLPDEFFKAALAPSAALPDNPAAPADDEPDEDFFADTTPDRSNPFYRSLLHAIDASFEGIEEPAGPEDHALQEIAGDETATEERETELLGLVGIYAIIGGYSGALIGLFAPALSILAYTFTMGSFVGWLFGILVLGVLGAIVWVPVSVIVAVITGIGGLVLGLGVGIVAAVLFRLLFKNPQALQAGRVLVALLNAGVFGYAAHWAYSNSFLHEIFADLTLMPAVFALLGALSGLVMGLVGPEKTENTEPLSDEETEEAMKFFTAPFRLWGKMAGPATDVSIDTIDDALRSQYDRNHPAFQKKEEERIMKELERELKKQERMAREAEERHKRFLKGDYRQ